MNMEKVITVIILSFVFSITINAQQQYVKLVNLSKYKNIQGVIFQGESQKTWSNKKMQGMFSPELNDLIKAEDIIIDICSDTKKAHYVCSKIGEFKFYKRQYIGRLNSSKEKILEIQFLNFKNKKAREFFNDWDKNYIIASGDLFYDNSFLIYINLNTGEIE